MYKLLDFCSLSLIATSFFSMSVNIQRSSNPLSDLGERVIVPSLVCSLTSGAWVKLAFFLYMNVKWIFWISRRKTSSQCGFHRSGPQKVPAICISLHPIIGVPSHSSPFSSLQRWLGNAQKIRGSSGAKRWVERGLPDKTGVQNW